MLKLLEHLKQSSLNWGDIARKSGMSRTAFSKHFNGHQLITPKKYTAIFRAILETTGAIRWDGRLFILDHETNIILYLGEKEWSNTDRWGIMDDSDLYEYLIGN